MIIDNIKNTVIKNSTLHGKGLFATHSIEKDTLLCVLEGQVLTTKCYMELIAHGNYGRNCFIEKYKIDDTHVAAMPFRTKYSFINHSDKPNVFSVLKDRKLYVYTSTNINPEDELVDTYNLNKHIDVLGGFKEPQVP